MLETFTVGLRWAGTTEHRVRSERGERHACAQPAAPETAGPALPSQAGQTNNKHLFKHYYRGINSIMTHRRLINSLWKVWRGYRTFWSLVLKSTLVLKTPYVIIPIIIYKHANNFTRQNISWQGIPFRSNSGADEMRFFFIFMASVLEKFHLDQQLNSLRW